MKKIIISPIVIISILIVVTIVLSSFGIISPRELLFNDKVRIELCKQECINLSMDFYKYKGYSIFTDEECRCKNKGGIIIEVG